MASALNRLKELLPALHLSINLKKCEIYSAPGTTCPQELNGIPVYYDHLSWSFLGAPLTTESQTCITSALDRFLLVNKRIGELALQHPEEALAVTRFCAGACKVLHILQAGLPPSQQNVPSPMFRFSQGNSGRYCGRYTLLIPMGPC